MHPLKNLYYFPKFAFTILLFVTINYCSGQARPRDAEQTMFSDTHLYQLTKYPTHTYGTTRYFIAKNLAVDINGIYPKDIKPNWLYIGDERYTSGWHLPMDMQSFVGSRPVIRPGGLSIKLIPGKNDGKAVLVVGSSYGELDIKGDLAVIVKGQQTFKVPYFQKIKSGKLTDEKSEGGANYLVAGGLAAEITLSADDNGNLTISLMVEYYRTATKFHSAGVSARYVVNDFVAENRMTPKLYYNIKRSDSLWEDKLKKMDEAQQAAFEIEIKDSYKKVMAKQAGYENPNIACLHDTSAIIRGSRTVYKSVETVEKDPVSGSFMYGSVQKPVSEFYDESFSGIVNTCSKPVTILGIIKLKSRAGTVYYLDKTIELDAGEIVKFDRLSTITTSFNPHTANFDQYYFYKTKLRSQ